MPFTIAVAGKGGCGKTTLASLVTGYLMRSGKSPVLAVDADPNANLSEALGVEVNTTVVETVDEIMGNRVNLPAGISKSQAVEYEVHDALIESSGFDLLVMGHTEGPGCYCYANDLLRGFLEKLSNSYRYMIMDNEAGMEHLSRRTTRNVDLLLLASIPTATALRSATRIHGIAQKLKLNIARSFLVLNHLNGAIKASVDPLIEEAAEAGLPFLGEVPYDEVVATHSAEGKGCVDIPDDCEAAVAIDKLMKEAGL